MSQLRIIGCSGSFPGPDSPASCYLIETEYQGRQFRLLLDLGSGALGNLQNHVSLDSIDAVALSHLHPDHCLDLCGFYVVRKYHPQGPMGVVDVFGPQGTREYIARAYGLEPGETMDEQFAFHEWHTVTDASGRMRIGPLEIELIRVNHPVEAYAMAVTIDDHRFVYTGDTGWSQALVEFCRGADVLLAEASFSETMTNPEDLHMTGRQAGILASQAGVGRLLLTHIPPWHDKTAILHEAKSEFEAVELVYRDAVYLI